MNIHDGFEQIISFFYDIAAFLYFPTSDVILFPLLQAIIILFAIIVSIKAHNSNMSTGGERGNFSMGILYAFTAFIISYLVGICLTVDIVEEHRVIWVVLDVILVTYTCLINPWFRNEILKYHNKLSKTEKPKQ